MSEYHIQVAICDYLQAAYPDVVFRSDLGGVRLHRGLRVKMKRIQKSRAYPDLFIAESRGGWHGLFIELKKDWAEVFCKNGQMRKTAHIQEQAEMMEQLRERGYYATWGLGVEGTIKLIDSYLANEFIKFTG